MRLKLDETSSDHSTLSASGSIGHLNWASASPQTVVADKLASIPADAGPDNVAQLGFSPSDVFDLLPSTELTDGAC